MITTFPIFTLRVLIMRAQVEMVKDVDKVPFLPGEA